MEQTSARTLFVQDPFIKNSKYAAVKRFIPKIIFVVLILVIAVEVVLAVRKFNSPTSNQSKFAGQTALPSYLKLQSPKLTYKVGDKIPITIQSFTGGVNIKGIDVLITFNPEILEVKTEDIQKGSIFKDYPVADVSENMINISGVTNKGEKNFIGTGDLAQLTFTAKKAGVSDVIIVFKPNSTADSNMTDALTGKDILKQTYSTKITIQ